MTARDILAECQRRGFQIRAHEGKVQLCPASAIAPDDPLRLAIREHKAELVALLSRPPTRREISIAAARQVIADQAALSTLLRDADRFMQDYASIYGLERVDAEYLHLNFVAEVLRERHGGQIVVDYGPTTGAAEPQPIAWRLESVIKQLPKPLPPTPEPQPTPRADNRLFQKPPENRP